jgi:aspartate aminotransferase-like enzyme
MRKSLLFIPGPVAVSEPVLAAMAKPLINHRGPEYARLLHSIAEHMHDREEVGLHRRGARDTMGRRGRP